MMKKTYLINLILLFAIVCSEGKKLSKSRGSGSSRGSSRKTNSNSQPTSISHTQQQAAPKPSLFGWQEKPAQRSPPKPTNTHSYPSSQTGLSGAGPAKQPTNQQSVQKSAPTNAAGLPQSNNQPSHSYPSSNGLSGSSGTGGGSGNPQQHGSGLSGSGAAAPPQSGGGYPSNNYGNNHQQGAPPPYSNTNGLSGAGVGYPKQQGTGLSGSGAAAPPPYSGGGHPATNYGNNYHHPQGPPPPYSNQGGYGAPGGYGGHGGYGGGYGAHNPMVSPQSPGYFGNYGNKGYGGVSRGPSMLAGVGIAGAGVGTILTGLALWNLARSTGRSHHTVIYDNRGQPVAVAPDNGTEPAVDSILGDLVNCTLSISNDNATEVLAIPCSIATSFTPNADVKDAGIQNSSNDNTKCTVTVVTKEGKEFMTTIPCSTLLNTAAENNVTEPPLIVNGTDSAPIVPSGGDAINPPSALILDGTDGKSLNCTPEPGDIRDPLNPCYSVTHDLTVIPLQSTDNSDSVLLTTPGSA